MATYHLHVGIVSRKTGRSAVAAAAYRAGEKLHNERDGITHDYTRKLGVVHSEIILPENAPKEFEDRSILWNEVEKVEKRYDAQTARDIDIALPVEFDLQEQIEIMRDYIRENFTAHGMCADFSIHNKGDGNPHAHILLTTRNVTEKGFGDKNRNWNKTEFLEQWRENWADICNEKFQEKGLDVKIDHRTLEAQGIDREPTTHIGVTAKAMERKSHDSDRMREYREILERNKSKNPTNIAEYMHELKQGYVILYKEISELKQKATDARREIQLLRIRKNEITERAEQIQATKKRIDELKAERQEMRQFTNKKAIDKQIEQLERSYEQASDYFKRNYHVSPDEAESKVKRLEYKAKDWELIQERLQDKLTPLETKKDVFAFEYQRQKLLADINPNGKNIQNELTKLGKETRFNESAQDKLAWTRYEHILDIVPERNFQAILNELSPEQAEELIERRENEREQEQNRRFMREQ